MRASDNQGHRASSITGSQTIPFREAFCPTQSPHFQSRSETKMNVSYEGLEWFSLKYRRYLTG
jgi:hypothetical protein